MKTNLKNFPNTDSYPAVTKLQSHAEKLEYTNKYVKEVWTWKEAFELWLNKKEEEGKA